MSRSIFRYLIKKKSKGISLAFGDFGLISLVSEKRMVTLYNCPPVYNLEMSLEETDCRVIGIATVYV